MWKRGICRLGDTLGSQKTCFQKYVRKNQYQLVTVSLSQSIGHAALGQSSRKGGSETPRHNKCSGAIGEHRHKAHYVLELKVQQLQELVKTLQQEKRQLVGKIDALAESQGESIFCASSVLTEQVHQLTLQLRTVQDKAHELTSCNASMQEDVHKLRLAKRSADEQSRAFIEQRKGLERDLTFYKEMCQQSLEERDRANFKLDQATNHVQQLDASLREASARLDVEQGKRKDMEARLHEKDHSVAQLNKSLAQFEQLPRVKRELESVKEQLDDCEEDNRELRSSVEALQTEVDSMQRRLVEGEELYEQVVSEKLVAQEQLAEQQAAYEQQAQQLEERLKTKAKEKQAVETSYNIVSEQLDKEQQSSQALNQQIDQAQARIAQLEAQLREQTAAKARANLELNKATGVIHEQGTQVGKLNQEVIELKARLCSSGQRRPATEEPAILSEAVLGKKGAPRKQLMRKTNSHDRTWMPGAPSLASQAKTAAFLGFGDVGM